MSLILIRYAELGLKSERVRQRFLKRLVRDITDNLERSGIDHLIESERGRIFVECSDEDAASGILRTINGIQSFSPVIPCGSEYDRIMECLKRFGSEMLRPGMSYGLKVRRVGTHPYTSRDIAINGGGAVISHIGEGKNRVDLKDPDIWIYVEIRENRSYIFNRIEKGVGGMPSDTQGRVLLYLGPGPEPRVILRALLSSLFMARRGCTVIPVTKEGDLGAWVKAIDGWKQINALDGGDTREALVEALKKYRASGVAYHFDISEMMDNPDIHPRSHPAVELYPTSGLRDDEVEAWIARFS